MKNLRAPYPWFGGKASIANEVWARLGEVPNFVEPFAGSLAMLLNRPRPFTGTETINDLDGFVPNFWRAIQAAPDEVSRYADWPVSELDMQARHLWLTNNGRAIVKQLRDDPEFFDAKIAGWWVWGICQWIGSGWCAHPEWQQRPHLGDAGMGIHRPSQQLPHLGTAGMGIHRPSQKLPHLGTAGMGIHRPSQKLPHLGAQPEASVISPNLDLYEYLRRLSGRVRGVRICCGDWSRVCGPTPTVKQGTTAVFLDPPYSQKERDSDLYAIETPVAADVRAWCVENGGDKRLRIALCGYAGEGHEALESLGWDCLEWKAQGGYGLQGNGEETNGRDNAKRERIWFSPACRREAMLF